MSATDKEMAPRAYAGAYRRREDARMVHRQWCDRHAARLAELPDELAKSWRTFALQKAWQWAQQRRREAFEITAAERKTFRLCWISQTRQRRFGSVEGLTEAEWRQQVAIITAEYWPAKQEAG